MTKDDIIRMARESGGLPDPMVFIGAYERFANLVAAHAMAQPCCGNFATCQQVCMPKGAAVERETIAQLFDSLPELVPFGKNDQGGCIMCGFSKSHAADAIRARGTT